MIKLLPLLFCFAAMVASGFAAEIDTDTLKVTGKLAPIDESNFYTEEGYATWGGHLYKEGDWYYLIYSRWKTVGGDWLTTSEVAVAKSKSVAGPFKHEKVLLKGRGKGHWDELMAHNPKIKKFGDTYYLYHISSQSGATRGHIRDSQRIGVATSKNLLGPYQHSDAPIVTPAKPVFNICVNPGVTQRPDGTYLMILKGDEKPKKPTERMGRRLQGLATSDSPTGPFKIAEKPALQNLDSEDASLWYDAERKRYYAIFHAHRYIGLITSEDGVNWEKAKHYKITEKSFTSKKGDPITVSSVERPYLFIEDGKPKALCISCRRFGKGYNHGSCLIIPIED